MFLLRFEHVLTEREFVFFSVLNKNTNTHRRMEDPTGFGHESKMQIGASLLSRETQQDLPLCHLINQNTNTCSGMEDPTGFGHESQSVLDALHPKALSARDPGSATAASAGSLSGRLRGLRHSNPVGSHRGKRKKSLRSFFCLCGPNRI